MAGFSVFPSRRLRQTPYTKRVEAQGLGGYTVYNHMLLPSVFASLEDDYHHLKAHVQLWDVAAERQVEIVGRDARKLASLISTRDLRRARPGRCYYAPVCDGNGGILNDPVALCLADDRFWFSISDSDMLLWAAGLAQGLNLNVRLFEPDISPLAVQGPKAEELTARVFGNGVRALKFFDFAAFPFQGRMLNIARSGWSKQGGFEIYLDDKRLGHALWDALWEAGEDLNVRAGCPNLIERLESGLLSYGNDMTRADTPLECGLDKFCGLDSDAAFIGKEALLRQRAAGVQKKLMRVRLNGDNITPPAAVLACHSDGRHIGCITSAAWSPDLSANIGFAMLATEAAAVGTTIKVADGDRTATVEGAI